MSTTESHIKPNTYTNEQVVQTMQTTQTTQVTQTTHTTQITNFTDLHIQPVNTNYTQEQVLQCYNQLINHPDVVNTVYTAINLMQLVAIATSITASLTCSGQHKKEILLMMIQAYINNVIAEAERTAALLIYNTLDYSIDVMFNFSRGTYGAHNGALNTCQPVNNNTRHSGVMPLLACLMIFCRPRHKRRQCD